MTLLERLNSLEKKNGRYILYGLLVKSDLDYPQLVEAYDFEAEPDIEIKEGIIPEEIRQKAGTKKWDFGPQISWLDNDTCTIIVENGNKITYSLKEGGRPIYLKTYILGWGMGMLAQQRGSLAIHCSALAKGDEAVLIAGESGAGKSTTAKYFLQNGYRLMADDVAFVSKNQQGDFLAYPAFPYQKQCRNEALGHGLPEDKLIYIDEDKDKFLVPYEGEFPTNGVKVKSFIMLGITKGGEVEAKQVKGFDQFMVIANNLFLRHLLGKDKYKPENGQKCLEFAGAIDIYLVTRPFEGDTTNKMQEAIKQLGFIE